MNQIPVQKFSSDTESVWRRRHTVRKTIADLPRDLRQWFAKSLWGDSLLLVLLLISGDLRLFQTFMKVQDTFKSSRLVKNKRHTNAHQPSPPSQQQRLQSPLSANLLDVFAFKTILSD